MEGRMPKAFIPSLLVIAALSATNANAVITQRVKDACRSEYYAYCSAHAVPSTGLSSCMRNVQNQLSQGCLKELVAAGEVSKTEIRMYKAREQR
jgi:hypothetical protein